MTESKHNAILISRTPDVSEITQLANTLEYNMIKEFIQQRTTPDVNFYIGSGKLEEIKEFLENTDTHIDLVVAAI